MRGQHGLSLLRRRQAIQAARRIEIFDRPRASDTCDHPPQDGPQVTVDERIVERLERVDDGVDLHARREGFAAASEKHQLRRSGPTARKRIPVWSARCDSSRRCARRTRETPGSVRRDLRSAPARARFPARSGGATTVTGVLIRFPFAPRQLPEKLDDARGNLRSRIFLQEMPAGHQVGSFGVGQQSLEARRECRCVEHVVFAAPDDQRWGACSATARARATRSARARGRRRRAGSSAARSRSAGVSRDPAAPPRTRPARAAGTSRDRRRTDRRRDRPARCAFPADRARRAAHASSATGRCACGIPPAARATPTCS